MHAFRESQQNKIMTDSAIQNEENINLERTHFFNMH